MIVCCLCNGPVPEAWQKLSHEDRENLKRVMGIKPVCAKCLNEYWLKQFYR